MDLTGQLSNPPQPLSYLADEDFPRGTPAPSTPATTTPEAGTPQKRLRPDEVRQLLIAYAAGATGRVLAARFGIHPTTVTAHLTRHGTGPRTRGLRPDDIAEAVHLYDEGWSTARLGQRYSVSARTINAGLRAAGATIRAPGRPRRRDRP